MAGLTNANLLGQWPNISIGKMKTSSDLTVNRISKSTVTF